MQLNRRPNLESQRLQHHLSKSKSPDTLREKIPVYKPKTLEQIFQETKRKKSSDKPQKHLPCNLKQSGPLNDKNQNPPQQKQLKNSLAALIAQSGHEDEIQSIQYTASEIEQNYPDEDFDKYMSQEFKRSGKFELRVLTPQCIPFSKFAKDFNPFGCKDDSEMNSEKEKKQQNYWNGQITLATSMCEDDFDNIDQDDGIPSEIKPFIDEKSFYVNCINSQDQSQFLMESAKPFSLELLTGKMMQMQSRGKQRGGEKGSMIKLLSVSGMEEFLAPESSHEFIMKHLVKALPCSRFVEVIYFVEAVSKIK